MKGVLSRLVPERDGLIDAGFVILLTLLALVGFRSAFGGTRYIVVGILACVAGVIVVHVSRRLAWPGPPAAALAVVVAVLLAAPLVAPDTALLGFLPSVDSFSALVDGVIRGWRRLVTTITPTGDVDNLMAIPYLCGYVAGALGYLIARRTSWLAVALLPAAGVLVVGILFGVDRPVSLVLQGAVFLVVALAWMSVRRQRTQGRVLVTTGKRPRSVGIVLMLALVAFAATVVGPRMPGVEANERVVLRVEPPFDPRDYGSPLAVFRKFKDEMKDEVLFTLDEVPEGMERMRLAVMDDYDLLVWTVAGGSQSAGFFERAGSVIPSDAAGSTTSVTVTVGDLGGVWVPTFGAPRGISFDGPRVEDLSRTFRYNQVSGVAAAPLGLQPGDQYRVTATLTELPPLDELRSRAVDTRVGAVDASRLPEEFKPLAAAAAANATNAYDTARNIEGFFQLGTYSDGGVNELVVRVPPGHSLGRIIAFLFPDDNQLVGNGEQYSAAMALLLSTLNVPSRVVMGFEVPAGGEGPTEVRGGDVVAWVEVALDELGWVAFSPTPDESRRPEPEPQERRQRPQIETQVPPPVSNPPMVETVVDQEDMLVDEGEEQTEAPPVPGAGFPVWVTVVAVTVGVPILLFVAFVAAVVALKARRRRRRRSEGRPSQRIAGGWSEVIDVARDQRRMLPTKATRREVAQSLGPQAPDLAMGADAHMFGPREPSEADAESYWGGVNGVLASMKDELSVKERLRATASLESLRHR